MAPSTPVHMELLDEEIWPLLERHVWAELAAALASTLAIILSIHTIDAHIRWNIHGQLRVYVVRILLMVPIYAVSGWLGLVQKHNAVWWDLFRETYEAVTIFSFFRFLSAYLGGGTQIVRLLNQRLSTGHSPLHHIFPLNRLLKSEVSPSRFSWSVTLGVLQYVPVQVVTALLQFLLTKTHHFSEGNWTPSNGYPYCVVLRNFSQMWAMYCLFWFYHTMQHELAGCHPFPKAMCIKGVVFFTFWQGVLIAFLVHFEVIQQTETYTLEDLSKALQDFIICWEMLLAAVLHYYFFPFDEFNGLPQRDGACADPESGLTHPVPLPFEDFHTGLVSAKS